MLMFVGITVMPGVTSVILLYALRFLFTFYFVFCYRESILFAFIFHNDLEIRFPALNLSGD